jgi:hypothetical protein
MYQIDPDTGAIDDEFDLQHHVGHAIRGILRNKSMNERVDVRKKLKTDQKGNPDATICDIEGTQVFGIIEVKPQWKWRPMHQFRKLGGSTILLLPLMIKSKKKNHIHID